MGNIIQSNNGSPSNSNSNTGNNDTKSSSDDSTNNNNKTDSPERQHHLQMMKYCFFKNVQHRNWPSVEAAVGSNPLLAAQRDALGCTTLHMTCSLNPPVSTLKSLTASFPEALRMKDGQGRLPLHVAVVHGGDLSVLVARYPGAVQEGDRRGQTPLHHVLLWHTASAHHGHDNHHDHTNYSYHYHHDFPWESFRVLLHASDARLIAHQQDQFGYTPLKIAWESYNSVVPWNEHELQERKTTEWNKLEAMLTKCATSTTTTTIYNNIKLLHTAASISSCPLGLWELLVERYPHQVAESDEVTGSLPLELALTAHGDGDNGDIVRSLLRSYPHAARRRSPSLPLHVALRHGRTWEDVVRDLFAVYPEALRTPDPATHLPPFCLPALQHDAVVLDTDAPKPELTTTEDLARLETMYQLLRADPSVLRCQHGSDINTAITIT